MGSNMQVRLRIPGQRLATGCFGDVGYIAKRPGHGRTTEILLESHAKERNDEIQKKNEKKALEKDVFMNEYWRKFDMIMVQAAVNQAVRLGMDQATTDLADKRNKLKSVLLGEQSEQITEYTRRAQEALDKQLDSTKRKAEEIMKRSGDSARKRAQEVYTKMAMENSDVYKSKVSMEMMKNAQEVNREIIRLKEIQKLSGYDEEVYWSAEAEKRRLKEMECIETEDSVKRNDETTHRQRLKRQLEEQTRIKKNEECVERLGELRRKAIQDEQYREMDLRAEEARRQKALGLQSLAQQMSENKALAKRNQEEEILVDKIMQDNNRRKLERELAAIEDQRMQNWTELVIFRQSMVEYRNAWQARTQEAERIMEECNKDIELKKYKARKAEENLRKDLTMECFKTCRRMAADNLSPEAAEKRKDSKAGELAAHYNNVLNKLSDAFTNHKREEQNPAPYNDESLNYLKVLQERQRLEDWEMLEKMRRLNDERERDVMVALERPLQEISQHQHPMCRFLKHRH